MANSRWLSLPFVLLPLFSCAVTHAGDLDEAIRDASGTVQPAYTFLHQNPELGKKEFKAQAYIRDALTALGFTEFVTSSEAPTAVIAVLDSGKPGPTIALRAEMDARPLEKGKVEPVGHTPRSQIDGVMHNCGHDIHAAILLGTASILIKNKDKFSGKIVFLFQPAEETPGGADDIVHEGLLPKLNVQSIFAQHVAPGLPVGAIAIAPGFALAGSNYFSLKIKGTGSHAAVPSDGTDTPMVAARMALSLSEFPARHLDIANHPAIISVTKLVADGQASNVIPADAEINGTVRSFENIDDKATDGKSLKERLTALVDNLAKEAGVDYEWNFHAGAPPTLNNNALLNQVGKVLVQSWSGTVDMNPGRGMFSEDFSYYTQTLPALYFSLGVNKDGHGVAGVHTAEFDVHPDAFESGLRLMTMLAVIGTTGKMAW